ncbi:hypothetical protein Pmani_023566 [Petrolisthes manimaculis]|uniref:Uncharacterized protein n=1 Tax=Petrolisthes manimaculis TaxID=1843537 RepID=A0AAE1U048_9EUCA|nr:hypothetical protein Pmani_023566 [Petrolisthes manimaculis]
MHGIESDGRIGEEVKEKEKKGEREERKKGRKENEKKGEREERRKKRKEKENKGKREERRTRRVRDAEEIVRVKGRVMGGKGKGSGWT